jgi:phage terminase large subunit GpA-like protein
VAVTGFIDVGHKKLNWAITAYRGDMSSTIIDYGEYPEGTRTLEDLGDETLTASVFRGLVNTIELMASDALISTDGSDRRIGSILIDCGDPSTRDAVFQVCRAQRFSCRVMPSRGRAHHMFKLPDPRKRRVFQNAYLDIWKGLGPVVVHDACIWRERFQRGLSTGQGGPGCVDIYGTADMLHREFATQLTSERLIEKLSGASGEVFKWTRVPGTHNHYLDCAVGCMVAATVEGLRYGAEIATIQTARQRKASASASGQSTDGRTSHSTAGAFDHGRAGEGARRKRGGFRTID